MNQKLAIIGTVGLPAKYGGFETLTAHLVEQLNEAYDMTVYCSKKAYAKEERVASYKGARLSYINLKANGIQSIIYDTLSILKACKDEDILLILGVAGAWILPFIRRFTNKKIVISIDGIEWKRAKWNLPAKLYLRWAEKIAVKYSHIDISDNESIQDYTALRYGTISRVIEYGADHTLNVKPTESELVAFPILKESYAFKVCRIEPENNISVVLSAFHKMPSKKLVVVGNWEANDYGKKLKNKYSNTQNIHLYDPIYDQRTIDLLRGNAALYVHGHSAGGTNPSLVEAMFLELPIVSYGVSYNKVTTEDKALYFSNEESLIATILDVKQETLKAVGQSMKSIASRRYKWNLVAYKYHHLFQEALTIKNKTKVEPKISNLDADLLNHLEVGHLKSSKLIFEKA